MIIPKEYSGDLAKIAEIAENVNKTHKNLSRLAIFSALIDAANRSALITGIAGTGKSTIANWISLNTTRNILKPHGLTVNGLNAFQRVLTQNSYTIIVEDLSRSGTEYTQFQTVSVLSGLVYTGYISKHTSNLHLDIHDFTGSALIYAQPLILRRLVSEAEFDSDIRDKCLRYYHLHKPLEPNPAPLNFKVSWSSLDRYPVKLQTSPETEKLWKTIIENMRFAVSIARALEHATALIRASAIINRRNSTTTADFWLIAEITKNFRLENYLFTKHELEGPRALNVNTIPILSTLITYKKRKVSEIAKDFQISERSVYRILEELGEFCLVNAKTVYPTKQAIAILREIGELSNE